VPDPLVASAPILVPLNRCPIRNVRRGCWTEAGALELARLTKSSANGSISMLAGLRQSSMSKAPMLVLSRLKPIPSALPFPRFTDLAALADRRAATGDAGA